MAQLRLNKSELRKQKTHLALYKRYLPTLTLRKQQLYRELHKVQQQQHRMEQELRRCKESVDAWVELFAWEGLEWESKIHLGRCDIDTTSVAGVTVPVLRSLEVVIAEYDLFHEPFWVAPALLALRECVKLQWEVKILERQYVLLSEALRVATQRVNLFEKVLIVQTTGNIRKIQIVLGDEEKATVVRGKIAKARVQKEIFV